MKSFTFSGMGKVTARFDFDVTVTPKDIAEAYVYGQPEFTVEDVEAWTDEQVRAYVEEHMLKDEVDAAFVDADLEYDDDMEFVVNEEIFEEVEG